MHICLSRSLNTKVSKSSEGTAVDPQILFLRLGSHRAQPASAQTFSIGGKCLWKSGVLDTAVGYTDGHICSQVRHHDILLQHGVQINKDYNNKKGHPRDVTETSPFSY